MSVIGAATLKPMSAVLIVGMLLDLQFDLRKFAEPAKEPPLSPRSVLLIRSASFHSQTFPAAL